jgi:hypothetical protein
MFKPGIQLVFFLAIINTGCQTNSKNQEEQNTDKPPEIDIGGDTSTIGSALKNRKDIIFYGGFEEGFNNEKWKTNWGIAYIVPLRKLLYFDFFTLENIN